MIPGPITNFARREDILTMDNDSRFSQFPSMAWINKGIESVDDLLTKNLRGPGTPPAPTPIPKDECDFTNFNGTAEENYKLANNPQNTTPTLAISRGNLEHVYLSQETVYRFMNLANMIRSNGTALYFLCLCINPRDVGKLQLAARSLRLMRGQD